MGTAERREREREHVRTLILEAARDLLSEEGLSALSMRAIAERIEYSPGTIYLYFRDKDELIAQVVEEGFERLRESVERELSALAETANAAEQYGAIGRAYVRFALENTAYFRVMFELPGSARFECTREEREAEAGPKVFDSVVETIERAGREGSFRVADARRAALIGWGMVHGLVSLYVGRHMVPDVASNEEFLVLVEEAMRSIDTGWRPRAGEETKESRRGA